MMWLCHKHYNHPWGFNRVLHLLHSFIFSALNHLEWGFLQCVMYGSVCLCSNKSQSPAVIQSSLFFYSSPLLHHCLPKLCCENPTGLLYCLTFNICMLNEHWELSNQRPQSGRPSQPPPLLRKVLLSLRAHHESHTEAKFVWYFNH